MSNIYSQAIRVIAWPGEKEDATEPGLELLKQLYKTLQNPLEREQLQDLGIENLGKLGLQSSTTLGGAVYSLFGVWSDSAVPGESRNSFSPGFVCSSIGMNTWMQCAFFA